MRQAIVTKFAGPTNHNGSRVIVKSQRGRKVYSWDHGLNPERNHEAAAEQYAMDSGWTGDLIGGAMPDGSGYCFVFAPRA